MVGFNEAHDSLYIFALTCWKEIDVSVHSFSRVTSSFRVVSGDLIDAMASQQQPNIVHLLCIFHHKSMN